MKANIKEMNLNELEVFFQTLGEQKYRAKQVFSWLYKGAYSFSEMTDLSKGLREKLEEEAEIQRLGILKVQTASSDGTRKYLFSLADGNTIETVFMQYKFGNSVCISSQAGCRMGCSFCASALKGLARNLTAAEMADQLIAIEKDTGEKIGNVVVMGTGEPFDNYENLCRFLELIHHKDGLNLGLRSITVSTCGIIPRIKDFAREYPQVNLAISLHASNDTMRSSLMPINGSYHMSDLLTACREHIDRTGRRMTFEYALISGVNDTQKHAVELADKLRGMICHVNLIPLNAVPETKWSGSGKVMAQKFCDTLEKRGIPTTIRREMGSEIEAACGQLRLHEEKN